MSHQYKQDFKFSQNLISNAPQEAHAFLQYKNTCERDDGIIPIKYRELISLAVAVSSQCYYCIDIHTKNAIKNQASAQEIAETILIAGALKAGAAVGHGLMAMRIYDEQFKGSSSST